MYKRSAPKRTGIYRINGNMENFQFEVKLRHISEWLPVPKFEYAGAKVSYDDHYPDSPRNNNKPDCLIYVPYEEHTGGYYCNYYNYYNPGSGYPGSEISGSSNMNSSRSYKSRNSSGPTMSSDQAELMSHHEDIGMREQPTGDDFYAQNKELFNGGTATLCIGWQQKHFSRNELESYADESRCITPLQRRYHRWTQDTVEQQERQRHQKKHDTMRLRRRKSKRKNNESTTPLSSLCISDISLTSASIVSNFATHTCLIHTLIDADVEDHTSISLPEEAHELHDQGYQLMYVYAQLQQDTLLLSLRYSPDERILYVYPDFNFSADDMDYVLEIDNDCRQLYAYGFQWVGPTKMLKAKDSEILEEYVEEAEQQQLPPQPLCQDESLADDVDDDESMPASDASIQELLSHHQRQRIKAAELRTLLQFTMPPKRTRRVTLLMELREAHNFEYPNIHVRYYINTPNHTLLEPTNAYDPFPLRGATATCQGAGDARTANFSHCWQLTLLCEESYASDELLHIYFEVISIDSWQRERCEGYAHFSCSLLAPLSGTAAHGIRLQCIRPQGSWLDALNRYFIGGRALFDFVGYFRSRDNVLHSRLEMEKASCMRSTGTVLFSIRKVQQRQQQLGVQLDTDDSDSEESGLRRVRGTTTTTLDEVLAAYVEARERIESLLGYSTPLPEDTQ